MRKLKLISALCAMVAMAFFVSCNNVPEVPEGPGSGGGDPKDTTTIVVKGDTVSVATALKQGAELAQGDTTEFVYIKGLVGASPSVDISYGNAEFNLVDGTSSLKCYRLKNIDNKAFTTTEQLVEGDLVVVYARLINYNGTVEAVKGYIFSTNNSYKPADVTTTGDGTEANPYTCTDVKKLNNTQTGNYWVKGYIVGQVAGGASSMSATTAEFANFTANDNNTNTNVLIAASANETDYNNCVPLQLPTGSIRDGVNLITNTANLGQEILVYGSLEKYFGATGVKSPAYAKIGSNEYGLKPGTVLTEPTATAITIAEFNAAAESTTVYYELTGTIGGNINTTYGNFDLTDATGTVYVYGLTKTYLPAGTTNDKTYSTLGLVAGDNITIRGYRGSFQGKIEVMGAYFVKKN